jgi:hypothetical protein
MQPALRDAWLAAGEATATDPELAEKIGTSLGKTVNAGIAFFNQNPQPVEPLSFTPSFRLNLEGKTWFDLLITPAERSSLKRTWDAFVVELNKNPGAGQFLLDVETKISNIKTALDETSVVKGLFDNEFGRAISTPFDAISTAIRGVKNLLDEAKAAWIAFRTEMGGGIFGGVSAGASSTPNAFSWLPVMTVPSAPSGGIPGAGRSANGSGNWNVTLNINAPGGNPQAVAAAAQTGVLAAARSMGLA